MLTPRLPYERYLTGILREAGRMAGHLGGADLTLGVPTCPEWNLAQLTTHIGEELRWLDGMVRSRAVAMADDTAMRNLAPIATRSGRETGRWIVDGASSLVCALREAGSAAPMWTPVADGTTAFFARRFAHEQVIHRIDVARALDNPARPDPETALDGLAEWMELGALPEMLEYHPHRRELLGPGRTLRVTATDAEGPDATWRVDLTGEVMRHRPGDTEPGAVDVRGPVADLLLFLYRRDPGRGLEVTGDRALLDRWVAASAFA